jgi:hypothetical protein
MKNVGTVIVLLTLAVCLLFLGQLINKLVAQTIQAIVWFEAQMWWV